MGELGRSAAGRLARVVAEKDGFNERYPVGSEVVYSPVQGSTRNWRRTRVVGPAYVLAGHTAVCFLEGVRGCVKCGQVGTVKALLHGSKPDLIGWDEEFEHRWSMDEVKPLDNDTFICARCHESGVMEEACWSDLAEAYLCQDCYEVVEEN